MLQRPKVFHVRAEYEFAGASYSEDNVIDVHPMLHSTAEHDPVATELERLRKSLETVLAAKGAA